MQLRSICALLLASSAIHTANATVADKALARPEGSRHYIVMEPASLPPEKRPTIILLHGHGASAASMLGLSSFMGYRSQDWLRLAEREKILLIAPDGVKASDGKRAWNDCRGDTETNATSDDVGFLSELIDRAITEHHADPARIYIYGASNGGGMAYRLGIELAPRLAAIGVSGSVMAAHSSCKAPSRPLSVFMLHGTADEIIPYQGGKLGHWLMTGRGTGVSMDETVMLWRKNAGLPDTPATYHYPHLKADDKTSATRYVWGTDPSAVQVAFVRVDGGGHVHASKTEELPWVLRKLLGNMNHDVDMADEMWNFFKDKRGGK
ncbi:PHB depolymerase family esterase [Pseudoduganella ginsengisoli]|uniref:Phospholipase/carboxylesterase/thioesterase domain-containing protein n=1 Tax=Pseudoduganella ginsengisoli TaxID=1462440 RepID=A0A6L6Q2R9_9BURK|nr:PHB depolymerase family esterase [Pseudoduganella ginsengisoli]MTW03776.1 hypothetical protein [Pseudoduganella ginsengisoli]